MRPDSVRIGDRVRLLRGGPVMRVTGVIDETVTAVWQDEHGNEHEDVAPAIHLILSLE